MAGIRGNSAWLALTKQAAKGAAVAPVAPVTTGSGATATVNLGSGAAATGAGTTIKVPFAGGGIGPTRATDRLAETDAARDQGALYVASASVEGSPEVYVRPDSIGVFLAGALGAAAAPVAGAAPLVTHTFTPADTLPYHTGWKMLGGTGTLVERYENLVIGSLTVSAEAGAPLTATAGMVATGAQRREATTHADFDLLAGATIPMDQEAVFSFNDATVSMWDPTLNTGAGAYATVSNVRSFELTIENNISAQQTDEVTPYDVAVGAREISLGFDMIFENITEYNRFHYGTQAAGTPITTNIYTTKAKFLFTKDANTSLEFELPSIAYEEFPIDPDPGGDPIVVSVRAVAQRASGVSNLVTAVLKNNVTSRY